MNMNKVSSTEEEDIQEYWCPAAGAPIKGFGNIPVCDDHGGLSTNLRNPICQEASIRLSSIVI